MKQTTAAALKIDRTSAMLVWILGAIIVILGATYIYFVEKTVWNVVARENTQNDVVALNSKLSDLEFQYISSVNSVTMDTALQLGFVPATDNTNFVAEAHVGTVGSDVAFR